MSETTDQERIAKGRLALRRFLSWLDGWEQSSLYEEYKDYEGFTDQEYNEVLGALEDFARMED